MAFSPLFQFSFYFSAYAISFSSRENKNAVLNQQDQEGELL